MSPRGIRNNNPLNIRKGNNWQGERHPQSDPAFEEFSCMVYGLRAGFILIRNYIKQGHNTLEKIIHRWAPPSENDTDHYLAYVATATGLRPDARLSFIESDKMCAIIRAMCQIESRYTPTDRLLAQAYAMAK